MVIDKETLLYDLYPLTQKFYKIIEVNLDEDTYYQVKIDDMEPHVYTGVQHWVDAFIAANGVHHDDIERFKGFFDKMKTINKWSRVYYRRWINDKWTYVCMEVVPMENFEEDRNCLILVRDIEDYLKDFIEQVGHYYE